MVSHLVNYNTNNYYSIYTLKFLIIIRVNINNIPNHGFISKFTQSTNS